MEASCWPSWPKTLTLAIRDGGLFIWDDATLNKVTSKRSLTEAKELQMDLVAYLIASTYDIALEKSNNVPESAGWEKFLLEFA